METKLKFKVGDKVRVKSLEWYISEEKNAIGTIMKGVTFAEAMSDFCAKVITIKRITRRIGYCYEVEENNYHWQDWMLEDEVITKEEQQENKNSMETKEMTKEQAREYLTQKKFRVSNITEARNVARFLKNLDIDILLCFMYGFTETLMPYYHETEDEYKEDYYEEITLQDILSIEIVEEEPEPKFNPKTLKPFDKVLVRDCDTEKWRARFFDMYEEHDYGKYGTTCSCFWIYCVPYNEETKHLHGTTEEAPEYYQIWKK